MPSPFPVQRLSRACALLAALPLLLHAPLADGRQTSRLVLEESRPAAAGGPGGAYAITPHRQALLDTIRFAEGTWIGGSAIGYRVLYGGSLFDSLERHPERVVVRRYTSAAAGAYQFLPRTWQMAARALGLSDFGPRSQDQAALWLVQRRGALAAVDRQGLSADVLAQLSPEWASLPTQAGASYYGQPVRRVQELMRFYQMRLEAHSQNRA